MHKGVIVVFGNGLIDKTLGLLQSRLWTVAPVVLIIHYVSPAESRIGSGIVRIKLDGSTEIHIRLSEHLAVPFVADYQLAPSKEEVVGIDVRGATTGDPCFFRRAQLNLERRNDLLREFVLHGKYIREIAIESLGPDVRAARSIDKL